MHTVSKMKIFTVCYITEAQMWASCPKMGRLDKTRTALGHLAVRYIDTQIFSYCLHYGQVHNAHAKQDENFYYMLYTDKHDYT